LVVLNLTLFKAYLFNFLHDLSVLKKPKINVQFELKSDSLVDNLANESYVSVDKKIG